MSTSKPHQMRYKAVILDRDGVLTYFDAPAATAHFAPLIPLPLDELAQTWQSWGQVRGFPTSVDDERMFFSEFWDHVSDELSLPKDIRDALHLVDYTDFMVPFSESIQTLAEIRFLGIKVGVLSNFSLASLDRSLERTGLSKYIDVACAAHILGTRKPEAEAYQAVLNSLDVEAKDCLFIDDERDCVEGGTDMGLISYLMDRTQGTHDFERKVICDLSAVPLLVRNARN